MRKRKAIELRLGMTVFVIEGSRFSKEFLVYIIKKVVIKRIVFGVCTNKLIKHA